MQHRYQIVSENQDIVTTWTEPEGSSTSRREISGIYVAMLRNTKLWKWYLKLYQLVLNVRRGSRFNFTESFSVFQRLCFGFMAPNVAVHWVIVTATCQHQNNTLQDQPLAAKWMLMLAITTLYDHNMREKKSACCGVWRLWQNFF